MKDGGKSMGFLRRSYKEKDKIKLTCNIAAGTQSRYQYIHIPFIFINFLAHCRHHFFIVVVVIFSSTEYQRMRILQEAAPWLIERKTDYLTANIEVVVKS